MGPFLFLTSLLLAASGALKARPSVRAGLGFPWWPMGELAAALVLGMLGFGDVLPVRAGFAFVSGGILLVIVSSLHHVAGARSAGLRRQASEGARLMDYVKRPPRSGGGG